MPRNRVRKTTIGLHTPEVMQGAIDLIRYEGIKIRTAAMLKGIPYTTLYRYYKKSIKSEGPIRLTPNYSVNRIFTDEQEKSLVDYIIKCSQMFYGLTPTEARSLAYETAVTNNIKVPNKWHRFQAAGIEWLYNFRKRHSNLSLRTPEGCSLSRATSFNKHNVNKFYDNLSEVMQRNERFGNGTRVYNLDETNTMTVQKSGKVLAVRGQKQVSKVTSAEKGTLVTTCYIVSATGQALPPVMIYPRVHFKNHMIQGAPTGTLGLATSSGWMNSDLFVLTMQHFIDQTQSSKDNPTLLIMDNFEAHICLRALNLAKENGVTILTVPPHSTGKLQPLDVAVFGPFKTAYNCAVDSWMMRNPGKTFSIYEVAACVREAHMRVMTPANICSAFEATGIFPYNRNIFTDVDFAPSEITDRAFGGNLEPEDPPTRSPTPSILQDLTLSEIADRLFEGHPEIAEPATSSSTPSIPQDSTMITHREVLGTPPLSASLSTPILPRTRQNSQMLSSSSSTPAVHLLQFPQPSDQPKVSSLVPGFSRTSTSNQPHSASAKNSTENIVPKSFRSPFEFRGLPKAAPRKNNRAPRRKGQSIIATDTPNKNEIEEREMSKKHKMQRKKSAKRVKKKVLQNVESSDDENEKISIYSEEEASYEDQEKEEDNYVIDPLNFTPIINTPKEGTFVLVQFKTNNKNIYYVGKVINDRLSSDLEVSFLRKCVKNTNKFRLPDVPDIAAVTLHDIKCVLPAPSYSGHSTKRQQGLYLFDVDFSQIDIR